MRWFLRILGLVLALAILTHLVLPGLTERRLNKVTTMPPYRLRGADSALYAGLPFVADLHSDAMLWGRDLNDRTDRGHVDIPRLIEANVALQAFTVVSKTPRNQNYASNSDATDKITALMMVQARHPRTWTSLLARGLDMADRLYASAAANPNFRIITSAEGLLTYLSDRAEEPAQTAGLLGVEGLHVLEGKLENLEDLYAAGFRMVAPVHFFDNEVGGSAHGLAKGGLTPFGKTVMAAAERKHMLIDLSHGSAALIDDVLDMATRPVIVSHTGLQTLCPGDRNLSDAHLKRIALNGGLVGIALFPQATCADELSATARAMRHAVDLMGLTHVALGSDFDGAVTTPVDVTGLKLLVPELRRVGFGDSEIAALLGGNVRDFLLAQLPAS